MKNYTWVENEESGWYGCRWTWWMSHNNTVWSDWVNSPRQYQWSSQGGVCLSERGREINKERVITLYLSNLKGNVKEKKQKTQKVKVCLHRSNSNWNKSSFLLFFPIIASIIPSLTHTCSLFSLLSVLCPSISKWIGWLKVTSVSGCPSPWREAVQHLDFNLNMGFLSL